MADEEASAASAAISLDRTTYKAPLVEGELPPSLYSLHHIFGFDSHSSAHARQVAAYAAFQARRVAHDPGGAGDSAERRALAPTPLSAPASAASG